VTARDVVVVGGGPVGLATAIAACRHGLAVTVVEARTPPLDKACGEGLMPAALAALATLGVELTAGAAFTGIRYLSGSTVAEADFPVALPTSSPPTGRGVRRTVLSAALVARAAACGVDLRFGERFERLTDSGIATVTGELSARFVIGADGLRSRVREQAGLTAAAARRRRFGVRRHYAVGATSARVEVHFGDRAEAYLTPIGPEETGVALLWEGPARGFDDLLARRFPPSFAARFAGAERTSRDLGAGPFRVRAGSAARGRVALVGDAAGYVDALTGEGLAIGLAEALALGEALAAGDLERYARRSARLRRTPETVTRLTLAMARRPRLRRRVMRAFAAEPALFAAALGALSGGRARALVPGPLARFALRLARPA
jgi:flavin-dependent dehydrogenase